MKTLTGTGSARVDVMDLEIAQAQLMVEEPGWGDSALPRLLTALEATNGSGELFGQLADGFEGRSPVDQALGALLPALGNAIAAYYTGQGRALQALLCPTEVRALDGWLSLETRTWSDRWAELDPSRRGTAASTRSALTELAGELRSRRVPEEIHPLIETLCSPSSTT